METLRFNRESIFIIRKPQVEKGIAGPADGPFFAVTASDFHGVPEFQR
jgi:hypothetical protein